MKAELAALNILLTFEAVFARAGSERMCLWDLAIPANFSFPCFNLITDDPKVLEWARDFNVYEAWNPSYCASLYETDFVPAHEIN